MTYWLTLAAVDCIMREQSRSRTVHALRFLLAALRGSFWRRSSNGGQGCKGWLRREWALWPLGWCSFALLQSRLPVLILFSCRDSLFQRWPSRSDSATSLIFPRRAVWIRRRNRGRTMACITYWLKIDWVRHAQSCVGKPQKNIPSWLLESAFIFYFTCTYFQLTNFLNEESKYLSPIAFGSSRTIVSSWL